MPNYPAERIKLNFNPVSGRATASPTLIQEISAALQNLNFIPEVYLIEPGCNLKAMVDEALHRKIRLFVVCGGDVRLRTEALAHLNEGDRKAAQARVPMRRFGRPEEVAAAVRFLAGDEASYITGSVLKVDGGIL